MFGRQVTLKLKPGAGFKFVRIHQTVVTAILREQQGFLDETIHLNLGFSEIIVCSLWSSIEDEARFEQTAYLEVLRELADVVEGTPMVKTFELIDPYVYALAA
jgi:hypothetical protein